MGVEPEEVEHVLKGKRTLPRPGKELVEGAGGGAEADRAGSGGAVPDPEAQRRRQDLRGGRFNAAEPKG